MKKQIVHTFFFNHPAAAVWDYLTKPELLEQWLMPNNIKPVVGHKFKMTSKPKFELNHDGHNYCEIVEVIPLKKLAYTWKAGLEPGKLTLDTLVTWTLTPKDNGTELHLVHSGFTDKAGLLYEGMTEGWVTHVGKIQVLLNNTK